MKWKIPKHFNLGAHTIEIELLDSAIKIDEDTSYIGLAEYNSNRIKIATAEYSGEKINELRQKDTFLHEVLHYVFSQCGRTDLQQNEQLIQSMATMMNQILTTME
jgi:hypothetical protein